MYIEEAGDFWFLQFGSSRMRHGLDWGWGAIKGHGYV